MGTRFSITTIKSTKIQILRGLAIVAVVFIHTTPGGLTQVICRPFLNFAVGMFLFLSGLLSDAHSWKPLKRLVKVLIPYAIWTFVYTIMNSYKWPDWIIRNYIHYLIFGDSSAIMYYVFVYCELTLLIPLIDKLANSRLMYLGFVISPLEIICIRLIPLVFGIHLHKYISTIAGLSCLGLFTYFYLGYLIGNGHIQLKHKSSSIIILWGISILIQMLEGYWYFSMGVTNCGTQMKISAVLSGVLFCIMAFRYLETDSAKRFKPLAILGDYSFGIYFSHLAIMKFLSLIPWYNAIAIYPVSSILLLIISLIIVMTGHKLLGRYAKYLAF